MGVKESGGCQVQVAEEGEAAKNVLKEPGFAGGSSVQNETPLKR